MKANDQLKNLIDALTKLVEVLKRDSACQWTKAFESDLLQCKELEATGFGEDDLIRLSGSITSRFQGMGSFNDYAPGIYNPATQRYEPILGTELFEQLSNEVFNAATQLRM